MHCQSITLKPVLFAGWHSRQHGWGFDLFPVCYAAIGSLLAMWINIGKCQSGLRETECVYISDLRTAWLSWIPLPPIDHDDDDEDVFFLIISSHCYCQRLERYLEFD